MEQDRIPSAPTSGSSYENGNGNFKRKRKARNKKNDNKWKFSTSSFILLLASVAAVEMALFYGWAYRNMLPEIGTVPNYDFKAMTRRSKGTPNVIRTIMQNRNSTFLATSDSVEQPRISVEERSKANPWPQFPPLVLSSPFIDFVHEGEEGILAAERKMKTNATHKVARGVLRNGHSINIGFVHVDTEIQQQKMIQSLHATDLTVQGTWNMLESMGVDPLAPPSKKQKVGIGLFQKTVEEEPAEDNEPPTNWTAQLPPWGQILDNYGAEPVMLGLERCQAYRDAVPPEQRMIAPAGMFSTGTNLLFTLLISNCLPPPVIDNNITETENTERNGKPKYKKVTIKMRKQFVQWQAPWGKHNPATARLHYATERQTHVNQSAVFPIVMTRHPYTWIHTICKHSYSARWAHDPAACDHRAGLQNQFSIRFGSNKYDAVTGKQLRSKYNGLTQFYRQWYEPYFLNTEYPMAMTRFEDLIYRPHVLVKQICDCVGGRMLQKFYYRQETVNIGPGHGHHSESGLLPSFVKYGKPLEEYYQMFSPVDKKMLKMVFEGEHYGLLHSMGYKQFDD